MYWLSVSAAGALVYFYCKGRAAHAPETAEEGKNGRMTVSSVLAAAKQNIAAATDKLTRKKSGKTEDSASVQEQEPEEAVEIEDPAQVKSMLKSETDPLSRHLLYEQGVALAYKKRKTDAGMKALVLELAQGYVDEFSKLKKEVLASYGNGIPVFKQLAICLEEEREFKKAVDVCETALFHGLDDGTKTGYKGRIERLNKKQNA